MPTIDNDTLITAILGSGLISGIVSAVINYLTNAKLKRKEFDLEYRKVILNKRIKAYEEIVSHINETVLGYRVYPAEYKVLHEPSSVQRFFIMNMNDEQKNKNPFWNFYKELYELTMPNWFWYTNSLRTALKELFDLLYKINNEVVEIESVCSKKIEADQLIVIGVKYNKQLDDLGFRLMEIIRNDFTKLHK